MAYTKGLHDLGDGCHAWLQPDGGWGWSNSGLVTGGTASLIVDTLFDLVTTGQMLDGIAGLTERAPVTAVVNTHSDGDHCFGNELVAAPGVEIIASEAAAGMITQHAVEELAALPRAAGRVGDYMKAALAAFRFDDITIAPPTRVFTGRLSVDVGGREVTLIEVGPAHTAGDVLVHVPDAGLVYAGDILFIDSTPIVWAGPPQRWVDACNLLLDLPVATIVPGHGPVTGKTGVAQVRDYLADEHIAGYAIFCDWSARDLQVNELPMGTGPAKSKDGAITLGPLLVTPDEIETHRAGKGFALSMSAAVNGQLVSEGRWDSIDWDFTDMIAYASRGTELRPGDVIGSGTVPTGCLFEHYATHPESFRGWLQPGDEVHLSVERLGDIRQRIIAGPKPIPLSTGF